MALAAAPNQGYVAHEWGTFTSLQDSTGKSAEGMDHADEALPSFVHGRESALRELISGKSATARLTVDQGGQSWPDPDPTYTSYPCHMKDCDFQTAAGTALTVTQKMETPVIYFYSPTEQAVKVDVDFPAGIITQYYPNATDVSPPLGKVDAVANGHVHWDVQVSRQNLAVPSVEASSIWAPSRQTAANSITASGENEKLLFYRGLGHFDTPFKVTDSASGSVTIQNLSNERVPQVFLLKVTPNGAAIREIGSIAGRSSVDVSHDTIEHLELRTFDGYLAQASQEVATALEHSGLYHDEALAMVNTWKKSYFLTPGLRVLYVLPREWTDRLLPLSLSPQPKDLVRTLVGRVEVMTAQEEQGLVSELKANFSANQSSAPVAQRLGRFAEAKLRRALQLASASGESPEFIASLTALVAEASK